MNMESKKHHYVSRFILRNFSDYEKQINIYLCKESRIEKNASMKDQFKKEYLYGTNCSDIEKIIFADDIETNFAQKIMETEIGKQYNNNDVVNKFIMSQLVRTPLFLNHYESIYNYAIEKVITDDVKKKAKKNGIDNILSEIDPDKKYTITKESLQFIDEFTPFFNSLDKYMIVTSDYEFIIGEHPVIIFHAINDMSKLTDPSTVVAMPIGYDRYLLLYRSKELKPKKNLSESHVRMFNIYQLQQTTNIIACHNLSENEIVELDDEQTKNIRMNRPLRKIGNVEFLNTFQDLHLCWDDVFIDAFDIKNDLYISLSQYAEKSNHHNLKLTLKDVGKIMQHKKQ
jgi:hypothetical protein